MAEQGLDLEAELSVMVARRPSGETRVYPPALNFHERQILTWSVIPASLPASVVEQAESIARRIAAAFGLEGILAVELFPAPGRPRARQRAGAAQPAQLVSRDRGGVRHEASSSSWYARCAIFRSAITGVLRPAAIYNLFGELWSDGVPRFDRSLEEPGVRLHLYGKRGARAGRKMGHLSAIGTSAEDALDRVRAAARLRLTDG